MDRFALPQLNDRAVEQARFAASRDRILLTLLALNLMLMAFFVVLTSVAKIDHRKVSAATQSMQTSVAPVTDARPRTDAIPRSEAVDDLRTRIADVFAPPVGYRVELLVQGARVDDDTLAALASALVKQGVAPAGLAIGARNGDAPGLRFTFLLLDPRADTAFAQAARGEP